MSNESIRMFTDEQVVILAGALSNGVDSGIITAGLAALGGVNGVGGVASDDAVRAGYGLKALARIVGDDIARGITDALGGVDPQFVQSTSAGRGLRRLAEIVGESIGTAMRPRS